MLLTRKSMYQPAMPTVGEGATAMSPVVVGVVLRVTILSSKLTVWVAEPERISTAVLVVSGVVIVKLAPLLAWEGAEVIVGRLPWDR